MGNSHSGHPTTCGTKGHLYTRKRSAIFSRINLGCAVGGSSIHSSEASIKITNFVSNEKSVYGDDIDHQKRYMVAYSPALVNLDENGESAFQEFLREYPGRPSFFFIND